MDAATLWTGTLTFELFDPNSQHAWRLGVVVRRELVSFWHGQRNLAMVDRDHLRSWMTSDAQPLERHGLTLTRVSMWIAVAAFDGPPAWLTPDDAARFRAVL